MPMPVTTTRCLFNVLLLYPPLFVKLKGTRVVPPSIVIICPLIIKASSLHRKATAWAISSGVTNLPAGVGCATQALSASIVSIVEDIITVNKD
jgi:hypothetical protein